MESTKNEPEVVISAEVPEEINKQFLVICKAMDTDPAEVIRDIVEHWVNEQEEAISETFPELSEAEVKKLIASCAAAADKD